jgi:hypothetical protein
MSAMGKQSMLANRLSDRIQRAFLGLVLLFPLAGRALAEGVHIFISIPDQTMGVVDGDEVVARFPVSTSRFGIGDDPGSFKTPKGTLLISGKMGDSLTPGETLKPHSDTGAAASPGAVHRDVMVTRVLWLTGEEDCNRNALQRNIYIQGTPDEKLLGKPVSWGSILMRSFDVLYLYDMVDLDTPVTISEMSLNVLLPPIPSALMKPGDSLHFLPALFSGQAGASAPAPETVPPLPPSASRLEAPSLSDLRATGALLNAQAVKASSRICQLAGKE